MQKEDHTLGNAVRMCADRSIVLRVASSSLRSFRRRPSSANATATAGRGRRRRARPNARAVGRSLDPTSADPTSDGTPSLTLRPPLSRDRWNAVADPPPPPLSRAPAQATAPRPRGRVFWVPGPAPLGQPHRHQGARRERSELRVSFSLRRPNPRPARAHRSSSSLASTGAHDEELIPDAGDDRGGGLLADGDHGHLAKVRRRGRLVQGESAIIKLERSDRRVERGAGDGRRGGRARRGRGDARRGFRKRSGRQRGRGGGRACNLNHA